MKCMEYYVCSVSIHSCTHILEIAIPTMKTIANNVSDTADIVSHISCWFIV